MAAATMPAAAIPGLTQGGPPASATMDTIMRMQAGLGLRTIADNINDPNRPTWEEVGAVRRGVEISVLVLDSLWSGCLEDVTSLITQACIPYAL